MKQLFMWFLISALISACQNGGQLKVEKQPEETIKIPEPITNYSHFAIWKEDFINRAINSGISANLVHRLMDNAQQDLKVISADKKQPEFTKMIWQYLDSAVSQTRIKNGREKRADNIQFFNSLENKTGVPASIITSIWGAESGYGSFMGNNNLVNSLSTLAFEGRRRQFAEEQLIALMKLIERGDIDNYAPQGSWAGGMGHTQFIPQTWLNYGIDGNNDGIKNPWTPYDALSSTANYLQKAGWKSGEPVFCEVEIPANFDYSLLEQEKNIAEWKNLGLNILDNCPNNMKANLWLPAGIKGPALLRGKNFSVIKVYNNADHYALAISTIAKKLNNPNWDFKKSWPREERGLSANEVMNLQLSLQRKGFDIGKADGILGKKTRAAFIKWQKQNGKIADGFISQNNVIGL